MDKDYKILPFFPLGVFLLPGEDIPLRIFEPRYLQLIEEARQDGFTFAIPYRKENDIMEFGCEVKLQQVVAESEHGNKVITVESVSLVRINSFASQMTGKLYSGGNVQQLPPSGVIKERKLIDLLINYTEHFDRNFLTSFSGNELRFYDIIKLLNLSSEDKYNFVLMNCDRYQERFLFKQIQYLILIRKQEMMLKDDFHLN